MKFGFKPRGSVLLLTCILILPVIFLAGCDGGLSATGTVYEWMDAPPDFTGEIYVDVDPPSNRIIKPLSNSRVYLFWDEPVETDFKGAFSMHAVVAPGRYMMDIRVEKEGYVTLKNQFQHNGGGLISHNISIFLARK